MRKLALVLFVIGCGGGGGIGLDDLPDELEDAQCDRAVACKGIQDAATCAAAVDFADDEFATIKAGVDDGTIKYDSDKASACIDSVGTSCDFEGFHGEDPCSEIFTGTVATGGACVISLQCANQGECVITGSCDPEIMCCTGTCMGTATESPIGGPCGDDMHFCATDSYCKPGAGTGPGTCTALVATEGAACDEIDACANPMYCNVLTQNPTCKKPAASGAACVATDLLPCTDSREYCDRTMLKCLPRVAVGGACSNMLPCVGFASCIGGTCQADVPAGGACTETGPDCAGNLDCINGTCALPPLGMTCMLP